VAVVWEPDAGATVKSVPVPDSATDTGFAGALPAIVRTPVRVPAAVGVKVTLIVQLVPAFRGLLVVQVVPVVAKAKSPPLAPPIVRPVILSAALPAFVSVTVCAALAVVSNWAPKVRLVDDKLAAGAAPAPFRITSCGLLRALSVNLSTAFRLPAAVGVNVTATVQELVGAKLAPEHVSPLLAKSPGLFPASATAVTASAAFPVFVSATVCDADVVPTSWFPNSTLVVEKPAPASAPPEPLSVMT